MPESVYAILPAGAALGLLAVLASGSIGLLAMTARCLLLEARLITPSKESAR